MNTVIIQTHMKHTQGLYNTLCAKIHDLEEQIGDNQHKLKVMCNLREGLKGRLDALKDIAADSAQNDNSPKAAQENTPQPVPPENVEPQQDTTQPNGDTVID